MSADPRCEHVPTSPGQTMCRCEDTRMWLELLVLMQAKHIAHLQRRLGTHEPFVVN
jgi:hypothetical protein